mmetsp:Transcript_808/g.1211  ORF Transcript_808/g.1211 Transcript_808/m.1211 type:complete len:415 (+) Transcript_808:165-1409(+)
MFKFFVFGILLSCGVWYALPPLNEYFLPDEEAPRGTHVAKIFPTDLTHPRAQEPPVCLFEPDSESYHFGRWTIPIESPDLHQLTTFQSYLQKKEWEFVAISTERYLIGMAIAQFNYASAAFIYFYDSVTEQSSVDSCTIPFGFFASVSNSSLNGCSSFSFMSLNLEMCSEEVGGANSNVIQWKVVAAATLFNGAQLKLNFTLGSTTHQSGGIVLSYPIGPNRAAYTHKSSGLEVKGTGIVIDANSTETLIDLNRAVGLRDWTRSMHARLTVWFWIAITWLTESGDRLGINLSHGVYPDPKYFQNGVQPEIEVGLENAIWLNDRVYPVTVPLLVQGAPGQGHVMKGTQWRCYTEDHSIDLTFVPFDLVDSSTKIFFLDFNFLHTFGIYNGHVEVAGKRYEVKNLPGILEDHHGYW